MEGQSDSRVTASAAMEAVMRNRDLVEVIERHLCDESGCMADAEALSACSRRLRLLLWHQPTSQLAVGRRWYRLCCAADEFYHREAGRIDPTYADQLNVCVDDVSVALARAMCERLLNRIHFNYLDAGPSIAMSVWLLNELVRRWTRTGRHVAMYGVAEWLAGRQWFVARRVGALSTNASRMVQWMAEEALGMAREEGGDDTAARFVWSKVRYGVGEHVPGTFLADLSLYGSTRPINYFYTELEQCVKRRKRPRPEETTTKTTPQ